MQAAGLAEAGEAVAKAYRPRWSDRVESAVFSAAYLAFHSLPRRVALAVGARLGDLVYFLDVPHRRIALRNLTIAFPDKEDAERRSILRRSCRNLGRLVAEVCHLDRLRPESVGRYIRVDDPERWESSLADARERGAILVTGHFGNWELLAYAQALAGNPITLVHRPMRNKLVDDKVLALRSAAGTRSIPKKSAAREALRAIRRRELLAIPADQNQTRRDGVFVDFFGLPASTTAGPTRLALLTGVPVYPVFLVREGETEMHRLIVLPEVEMVRTGDREADVVAGTQRCTRVLEGMIRAHPEQWIWFHKRWKTQAVGTPPVYG